MSQVRQQGQQLGVCCRVENWRGHGRNGELLFAGGFRPLPVPQSVPWCRFQFPPRQTQHADLPHCAFLLASCRGLCDLAGWADFQRQLLRTAYPVRVEQTEAIIEPAPTPPVPAEALALPGTH